MDTTLEELEDQLEQTKQEIQRRRQEKEEQIRAERLAEMMRLRDEGLTYEAIGGRFGLSRQRVHQIINAQDERLRLLAAEVLEAMTTEAGNDDE